MSVTSAAREAIMAPRSKARIVSLFNIKLPSTPEPTYMYLCTGNSDVEYGEYTYVHKRIEFDPPKTASDSDGSASMRICVVDQDFYNKILKLSSDEFATIEAIAVLDMATGTFEFMDSFEFSMTKVQWTAGVLTATLTYDMYLSTDVLSKKLDRFVCPGCF